MQLITKSHDAEDHAEWAKEKRVTLAKAARSQSSEALLRTVLSSAGANIKTGSGHEAALKELARRLGDKEKGADHAS